MSVFYLVLGIAFTHSFVRSASVIDVLRLVFGRILTLTDIQAVPCSPAVVSRGGTGQFMRLRLGIEIVLLSFDGSRIAVSVEKSRNIVSISSTFANFYAHYFCEKE